MAADLLEEPHDRLMDAVYRNQRHIYDVTRKFFLFGRDRMIAGLDVPEDGSVLEVACGTGRNLVVAARLYPGARLHGLDISSQMLKTAAGNVERARMRGRIVLARGDATQFDPEALFGVAKFDRIFMSYALSMIPPWELAIRKALRHLSPGGSLHVVDFGGQERLPRWVGGGLRTWLRTFHVEPRGDLEAAMRDAAECCGGRLQFEPLYRDYARHGIIRLCT